MGRGGEGGGDEPTKVKYGGGGVFSGVSLIEGRARRIQRTQGRPAELMLPRSALVFIFCPSAIATGKEREGDWVQHNPANSARLRRRRVLQKLVIWI